MVESPNFRICNLRLAVAKSLCSLQPSGAAEVFDKYLAQNFPFPFILGDHSLGMMYLMRRLDC